MASLYETLSDAQQGEAIAELGREFGLTPEQTQAAVESLLPAISLGLKQSTATPEGLGELFAIMGRQTDLPQIVERALNRVAWLGAGKPLAQRLLDGGSSF